MTPFELARPGTAAEAVQQLTGDPGSNVALAGGQDVLSLLKDEILRPDRVVNLKTVADLKAISVVGGTLGLGALATLSDLADSAEVRRGWPVLAQAAGEAATLQIRNLGTVGGNLCQKPRCWYYRAEPLQCARKGGDACLAVVGDNRYHSIFMYGACVSPSLSSLATPLTALGATVEVQGPNGARKIPMSGLYTALKDNVTADTSLQPNEIVTRVTVPAAQGWRMAHEEVRHRASHDWPLAVATVLLRLDGDTVREARIVLGAVAPVPWVAEAAAQALVGKAVDAASAGAAAEAALADAEPLEHNGYKVPICRNLVRRTILAAAGKGEA